MLTIEELKSLEVGDWVYIVSKDNTWYRTGYVCILEHTENGFLIQDEVIYSLHNYSHYGTKWVAYKNKEEALKHYGK